MDLSGKSSTGADTASPLLDTKLYIPKSRSGLVSRPRLVERLRHGVERKLTLVLSPGGFGKTTLLAEWLATETVGERAVGWVSLDASENEPALFWAYFIRALQNVHAGVGSHALSLLHSPHPPAIESVLTAVINEINAIDSDFVVILDDYHVIDAPAVHNALTFLLDHLPPRMHVVIASRAEPPLALSRLRARGELTELTPADLRFTLDEATAFLNQVMALDLSPVDTQKLERRTEGWITGLKLAALSMKGRSDVRGFVDSFSGDNRYIADYLVDEVLQAEPERVRRFLLATAILDRLSGPLCDAVTGEAGSQSLLETLERRNLFVVALDDRREWYRYHHLFADVLQAQSMRDDPGGARTFHRRASEWYERHGSTADAVRHALGGDDPERAASLLETAWPEKDRSYQSARWLDRVKALPDAIVRVRPVLGMGYAWGLLNSGELEAAEARLRDVERSLEGTAEPSDEVNVPPDMVVVDHERFRSLPRELAAARIYLAQALGEAAGTVEHAKRALERVPDGDHASRATATALLALALWARGDLDEAYRVFADALAVMRMAGHGLDAIRGEFILGDIRIAQGRLHDAASIYQRGLQLAAAEAPHAAPETDELYLGLSELDREWGNLEAAEAHLRTITALAERTAHKGNRQRWCTAMARMLEARGDLGGALALLDEAETHERRDPIPRVRPIPAMKARIRVGQGRLAEAMDWVRDRRLSVDDDLGYLHEFEHITLARVLIARHRTGDDEGSRHDAVRLLDRLTTAAERGGRTGSLIEILVLQSLAEQALGNLRRALDPLAIALGMAEPEGYLRVFVDEGSRIRELLRHATARGVAGEYTRRVLSAFDERPQPVREATRTAGSGLVQSLTTRELEILRLIAGGLRNQEIADHLGLSAATVKRHIANAYGKLGASHRTDALAKAKALKLL